MSQIEDRKAKLLELAKKRRAVEVDEDDNDNGAPVMNAKENVPQKLAGKSAAHTTKESKYGIPEITRYPLTYPLH